MSDLNDKKTVSSSLQVPQDMTGESFRVTARASVATLRISKALDELGRFDWDVISNIIQDTLDGVGK